jgi:hypothetical protein
MSSGDEKMHFLDASTRWSKQGITGRSAVTNLDVGYNDRTMNKLHEIKRWVSINRYLRNIRFVKEDVMGIYIYIYRFNFQGSDCSALENKTDM